MVATHVAFDVTINILIILNMIPISLELSVPDDVWYMIYLKYINYVYCAVYVLEAAIKVCHILKCLFSNQQFYILALIW